jgi:hypothetical protein
MALGQFIGTEDPANCSVVRATYASGAVWKNPDLDQTAAVLPTPTPKPKDESEPEALPGVPVAVSHCTLVIGGRGDLQIDYRNLADHPADRVIFRANYAASGLDFTDDGSFSPNARITHDLKVSLPDELKSRAYMTFDDPSQCAVVSVHYSDGTSWQNSSVATSPAPLPTPVPNAIDLMKTRLAWSQKHPMPTPVPINTPAASASQNQR